MSGPRRARPVLALAIALALGGCKDRPAARTQAPTPADAARANPLAPDGPLAAIDAAPGLAITAVVPGMPPPAGANPRAVVLGGARFTDADGPHAIYLLEVASRDRRSIAIAARYVGATDDQLIREVDDRADACPDANLTGFAPVAVAVTDRDGDGHAEVGFGYFTGCGGTVVTAKQLVLEGDRKYIIRGSAPDAAAPEPAEDAWPTGSYPVALAAFRDNAAALDVADVAVAPDTGERFDASSSVEQVTRSGTSGGVAIDLSYPRLPMLARSEAALLTGRMRSFLDIDARFGRNLVGDHQGLCAISLITSAIASLDCQVMTSVWTRREMAANTGGAPAGPARIGLNLWRAPASGDVAVTEFVASPPRDCPWTLDPDGLVWLADENRDDPCPAGHLDWDALTPTTARARALIATMAP